MCQDTSDLPVSLCDFKLGQTIGKGAFGKVKIILKKDTLEPFALKYVLKEQSFRKKSYRNIFRERTILTSLNHEFIVNLKFAFHDDLYMFMVLDLMLGGDLRFHLHHLGKFSEEMTLFYAAELCSAIIYLHEHQVIHRDIKPDNILLDAQGHAHLTDFNCAVLATPHVKLKKEIGTHGYIAPEVYGDQGYDETVDWWSLGIVLWECLHGMRPFSDTRRDLLIYKVKYSPFIYSSKLTWPMRLFLESLLERDPEYRLGAGPTGHHDITSHLVFHELDWNALQTKQLPPPFTPPCFSIDTYTQWQDSPCLDSFLSNSCLPPPHPPPSSVLRPLPLLPAKPSPIPFKLKPKHRTLMATGFKYYDYRFHRGSSLLTKKTMTPVSKPISLASEEEGNPSVSERNRLKCKNQREKEKGKGSSRQGLLWVRLKKYWKKWWGSVRFRSLHTRFQPKKDSFHPS